MANLLIALVVLSAVFWLVERRRRRPNRVRRTSADTWVDVAYWFFTPLVTRAATRIAVAVAFGLIALWQGLSFEDFREL